MMTTLQLVKGNSPNEIWSQIETTWIEQEPLLEDYQLLLEQDGKKTIFYIDIDLGGGFEGGYAVTKFISEISLEKDFQLALHRQHFLDEIGKFIGMEDQLLGFPDFDSEVIVKTTHLDKVKKAFSEESTRHLFKTLDDYTLFVEDNDETSSKRIVLEIEKGITNTEMLKMIYTAFFHIRTSLENDQ